MENQNESPVVKMPKSEGMSFPDAIKELIDGKKITRLEWDDDNSFGLLRDGFLMIHLKGIYHQWLVNDGDLLATDWIIISNAN